MKLRSHRLSPSVARSIGVLCAAVFLTSAHTAQAAGVVGAGGVSNESGTLSVTNSIFTGNAGLFRGGGISNNGSGRLTITNSTFTGNNVTWVPFRVRGGDRNV